MKSRPDKNAHIVYFRDEHSRREWEYQEIVFVRLPRKLTILKGFFLKEAFAAIPYTNMP